LAVNRKTRYDVAALMGCALVVTFCLTNSGCGDSQATTEAPPQNEADLQFNIERQLPADWEVLEWSRDPATIGQQTTGEITVSYVPADDETSQPRYMKFVIRRGQVVGFQQIDQLHSPPEMQNDNADQVLHGHVRPVACLALSADGRTLVSGDASGSVRIWDLATKQERHALSNHEGPVASVAFSAAGKDLFSASRDGEIRRSSAEDGSLIATYKEPGGSLTVFASPLAGDMLASAGGREITLWDAGKGTVRRSIDALTPTLDAMAFSPNAEMLVSAGSDAIVRLWNAKRGAIIHELHGHEQPVTAAAFSPDGSIVATGSAAEVAQSGMKLSERKGMTVCLWDVAEGKLLRRLKGHRASISALSFSPDGATLASASQDVTVRLWDVASGQELRTIKCHTPAALAIVFTRDGKTLITAGADGPICLWNVD
jgi:WD40 repeat protein